MDDRSDTPTPLHSLRIEGREPLRCIEADSLPVGFVFDLAEGMDAKDEMRAIAAMWKFIKSVVVKEEHARLREYLYDTTNPVTFAQLNTAIGTLMREYSGRPTTRPSSSAHGRASSRGSSRVVSLSRATEKDAPPSTPGTSAVS